jgi:hypothetical protein
MLYKKRMKVFEVCGLFFVEGITPKYALEKVEITME